MSLKDFFNKKETVQQIISSASANDLGLEIESAEAIEEEIKNKNRFEPHVDFSKPENFAKFGSAEQYYAESIKRIYKTYPYDGSLKEKTQWHNSSSFFDKYVLETIYPKSTGYAIFSSDGWGGNTSAGALVNGVGLPENVEYIQFFGGPNPDPDNTSIKDIFPSVSGKANIYDSNKNRESNLKLDFDEGVTVEFWLKKGDVVSALTGAAESIFDIWNGDDTAAGYGRLLIYLRQSTGILRCRIVSGSIDSANIDLDTTAVTDNKWHHHAVTFKNTDDDGFEINYYKDGALTFVPSLPTANNVNEITGSLIANIGAFRRPSTSQSTTAGLSSAQKIDGYGKLSGSIDEFRFWKEARNAKEIGRNWLTQVYGGTNTDDSNTKLGVYYKFNEGITTTSSIDSIVLDYSGRLSSGSWTGYSSNSRNTGSAILSASAAAYEFEDPIIYVQHQAVTGALDTYSKKGRAYDYANNAAIYNTIPEWIRSDDSEAGQNLLKLTQIMASYFDSLSLQIEALPSIKNAAYNPFSASFETTSSVSTGSHSYKPLPFANRLLESAGLILPEIFVDADIISQFAARDEKKLFKDKLYNTKNLIYQNLYNNLVYLYKSKGTEKAFRNAIRCYGVDDEIIKVNVYGNNITYEFKNSYNHTVEKKNYVDFNHPSRFQGIVYQQTSSVVPDSVSFISGAVDSLSGSALTLEAEIVFPERASAKNSTSGDFIRFPNLSSSLFGFHGAISQKDELQTDLNDTTFPESDPTIQLYAIRDELNSSNVYFQCTSSMLGINITSSVFYDVYDNEKWNFAVRLRPSNWPLTTTSGAIDQWDLGAGTVEFCGFNATQNYIKESFSLTQSVSTGNQSNILLSSPKRVYVGADRLNFTGSTATLSDVKASSVRYWIDYLPDETIEAHAKDAGNVGLLDPYQHLFNPVNTAGEIKNWYIPKIDSLVLNYDFAKLTGSDSGGYFAVDDISSGSVSRAGEYGDLGNIIKAQHTATGFGFPASSTKVVDRNYIPAARQRLPESVASSDMIEIRTQDDINFTRETRPITHFISIEKSMYQTISEEMLKMFATIKDFNSVIGDPVNRYRQNYKKMEKLRQLFFERVEEVADLDRYINYYKWLDASIDMLIEQFFPMSADSTDSVRNMVESHVLERNKYWTKFPTLEAKQNDIVGRFFGIGESTLNWRDSSAPLPESPLNERKHINWWKTRANRYDNIANLSSSNNINDDRETLRRIITTDNVSGSGASYKNRALSKPYRFSNKHSLSIHGGHNFPNIKSLDSYKSLLITGSDNYFELSSSDFTGKYDLDNEVINRIKKQRQSNIVRISNGLDYKGEVILPFSIYSSSVGTGSVEGHITNIHHDTYGDSKETPMQGPFTEKYVGGMPHRHVLFPTSSDMWTEGRFRPEAWKVELRNYSDIGNPTQVRFVQVDAHDIKSWVARDGLTKRPVNIRNIQQLTGNHQQDTTVIGNFDKIYQVVQTSGRTNNSRYFVETNGEVSATVRTGPVSGVLDYGLPDRGRHGYIFVERFSAPGGPEVMSRGFLDSVAEEFSIYNNLNNRNLAVRQPLQTLLTRHMGKFGYDSKLGSPSASYIKIPSNVSYRIEHTASGIGGLVHTSSTYDNWYIRHQIPRSDLQYQWITASALYVTGVTPEPIQVKRLDGDPSLAISSVAFGYQRPDYAKATSSYPGAWGRSTDIMFASSSDFGSYRLASLTLFGSTYHQKSSNDFTPTDFVGLNYHIVEPITSSTNHLGYPIELAIPQGKLRTIGIAASDFLTMGGQEGSASLFNALMLNRNGPYHYPSWKQTRTGEHPLVRHMRKNNLIDFVVDVETRLPLPDPMNFDRFNTLAHDNTIFDNPINPYSINIAEANDDPNNRGVTSYKSIFENKRVKYKVTPVTNKYKPMEHNIEVNNSALSIRHTYGNNLNYLPISGGVLDSQLGFIRDPDQVLYDEITEEIRPEIAGIDILDRRSRLNLLNYREIIFPGEENAYLGKVRGRQHYSESAGTGPEGYDRIHGDHRTFWRNNRVNRLRTDANLGSGQGALNSMGIPLDYERSLRKYVGGVNGAHQDFCENNHGREFFASYLSTWPLDSAPTGSETGELYSNPYAWMSESNNTSFPQRTTPTASQTFFWPTQYRAQALGNWGLDEPYHCTLPNDSTQMIVSTVWFAPSITLSGALFKPQYSASALSGKTPMYDTYEDWAVDVRTMGQGYSLVPEFRVSDHMEHYINNDFRPVENSKFLSLDGAQFTSSADTENSDGNKPFYKTYSHSDFLKFVQVIKDDYNQKGVPDTFTLKCKAVKKLLPYNGFYPVNRCIQLGSLFSQSYGPHLFGDVGGVADNIHPYERLQSVLQPLYAPGIMYNTIKSGIAVDWPGYTGSQPPVEADTDIARLGFLSQTASAAETQVYHNKRYPFEAIINPEDYFPKVGQTNVDVPRVLDNRIFMTIPPGMFTASSNNVSKFTLWSGDRDLKYSLASNNFFGEVPRFFLEGEKFQSFKSRSGKFELLSGTTYFMDITLNKSQRADRQQDMIMYEGPDYAFSGSGSPTDPTDESAQPGYCSGSGRGMHYGPPCKTAQGKETVKRFTIGEAGQDPSFAPYTPPYFYGTAVARVQFSPHKHRDLLSKNDLNAKHGEYGTFSIDEIIAGARSETIFNPDDQESWDLVKNYGATHPDGDLLGGTNSTLLPKTGSLAYVSRMKIDASIDIFGMIFEPQVEFKSTPQEGQDTNVNVRSALVETQQIGMDAVQTSRFPQLNLGVVVPSSPPFTWEASTGTNRFDAPEFNSWVISPRFETPILNFSGNSEPYHTRGMWYGYGTEPLASQGIYMKLRESHPQTIFKSLLDYGSAAAVHGIGTNAPNVTDGSGLTGSLLQALGFKEESGELTRKLGQIAERKIISEAVVAVPYRPNQEFPFFEITRESMNRVAKGEGSNAIRDMVEKMQRYYFPPHMDFLTNREITPFAMYIFEFHHCLRKQDLIDIWQNLMPKIAMEAEKDEAVITHTADDTKDFFNINKATADTRWMLFKVKKRSEQSYYNVTANTFDDDRFTFQVGDSKVKPEYNYNWPYDFFSLVELVQVEADLKWKRKGT